MYAKQKDGSTLHDHLMMVQRTTKKVPKRLAEAVRLPPELHQLWQDFMELHRSRGHNGFGPMRITFTDIYAWQQVTGIRLRPWQIEAIQKADNEYFASLPKKE